MAKAKKSQAKVGTTLNTDGLIREVAERSKSAEGATVSQTTVHTVVSLMKDVVADALAEGQRIQLTGFVTFTPSFRNARKGNDITTGKMMDIPECVVATAKVGKALKDATHNMAPDLVKAIKEGA